MLTENNIFFPLLRLITNSSAALTTIHKKHGELVLTRFFGKLILFVSKPEHIEHIFSQEAKGNVSRDALYDAKKPVFGDGLVNSKNELWTRQRKLMQPFFNKDAITCWNELMVEEMATMVNRFKETEMSEINISKEIKLLVQSIVTRILFGNQLDNAKQSVLMECVDTIIKGLVPQLSSGVLGSNIFNYLFIWQNRSFNRAVKQFADFVEHALNENASKDDHSLLSLLSQATDKKTGYAMTEALLKDEAITLYLAGQDTTINTVVWFLYLIGKHEAVQHKIIEEVLRYKNEPLTPENIAKLTYTKAALSETLRKYPAATAVSRNPIVDDFVLDGNSIAKDTTMLISIYAAHHDAQSWEKPDDFYPEHFSDPELAGKRHRHAYLPFGGGIHNCIGRHLAEQEMLVIIVSLLREFSFKTEMTVKTGISVTMKPDRDVLVSVKPSC
ncbi:cytochrome P450 [Methyloglobulus sp.]|uniref:cytochrome P450 n=1 Tax=Methyloglobulus sp. TaxID=2518622 RepID=UPI0032B84752